MFGYKCPRETLTQRLRSKSTNSYLCNETSALLMEAAVTIETMEREFKMALLMNDMANYIDKLDGSKDQVDK